jgi:type 1 glutamine amidotransferase
MRAVILNGSGRYADPWHRHSETSEALAELVAEAGFTVDIVDDVDSSLASLPDEVVLIVVNAGDTHAPTAGGVPSAAPEASVLESANAAVEAAIDRGIGILALHTAAASLRDYPVFERALGARWVRDRSWHPPIGEAAVHVVGNHRIAEGLEDFTVFDERYTDFRLDDVIEPIAEHEHDGVRHPLVWAREVGRSRLVYDALGHDVRSYDSAGHRALLAAALDWLSHVPAPTATER